MTNTRVLTFDEMALTEGGWKAGLTCSVLMGGWGMVVTYGTIAGGVTAGTSLAIAGVWTGLTVGLCGATSIAESGRGE